jgi:hypothetical protein
MLNAKLYLIDLAGSERVSKTDASGDRLKEVHPKRIPKIKHDALLFNLSNSIADSF